MKPTLLRLAALLAASAFSGGAATLTVSATATSAGGLYQYAYSFAVNGAASVDNVFLGSDDLSPLAVTFTLNGASTSNWSWLGNDTPQNYLQFFSTNRSSLNMGDSLGVRFTSALAPASSGFALGLDGASGAVTNRITGVLSPEAAPGAATVPEPSAASLLLAGLIAAAAGSSRRFRTQGMPRRRA